MIENERAFYNSIKKRNEASRRKLLAADAALLRERRVSQALAAREFVEGQAALNLLQFSSGDAQGKLADDETRNLIYTLQVSGLKNLRRSMNLTMK